MQLFSRKEVWLARPPRIQFDQIVTRGDGRRKVFHDPGHHNRFTQGFRDDVRRNAELVLAYGWMLILQQSRTLPMNRMGVNQAELDSRCFM